MKIDTIQEKWQQIINEFSEKGKTERLKSIYT